MKIILSLLLSLSAFAGVTGKTNKEVLQNAKEATVYIKFNRKDIGVQKQGSGFFISNDGIIVTNTHVVEAALENKNTSLLIQTYSGEKLTKVKVLKCYDKNNIDICFLKANYTPKHYFNFKDRMDLGKGNQISMIGHCGNFFSHKSGKVFDTAKVLNEKYQVFAGNYSGLIFKDDFKACPGDSGGAIFYIDGISKKKARLVGVMHSAEKGQTWKDDKWVSKEKYKVAIDSNNLEKLYKDINQVNARNISSIMEADKKKAKKKSKQKGIIYNSRDGLDFELH
jgi:S1-C subfamily serine protease